VSAATAPEVTTCRPRDVIPIPDVTMAVAAATLLADPTRASILRMLADGAYCVCEIAAALGAGESNISNHLAKLRHAGLVRASRNEANLRFTYYERDEAAVASLRGALVDVLR
jgi:DNA-binding transcriptional ArsR family regulator